MKYISIDGDDVGRAISACYLSNDKEKLSLISDSIKLSAKKISNLLEKAGFCVIFCAADGVVAFSENNCRFENIFSMIGELAPPGITYSAGVGDSLSEAYLALIAAKGSGKNKLYYFSDIG